MGAERKKYFAYARECARQAREATSAERRDKLLELSRVWMIAALTEGNANCRADGEPRVRMPDGYPARTK
jgi:hypothetical protein